jgi:hypothetical protein
VSAGRAGGLLGSNGALFNGALFNGALFNGAFFNGAFFNGAFFNGALFGALFALLLAAPAADAAAPVDAGADGPAALPAPVVGPETAASALAYGAMFLSDNPSAACATDRCLIAWNGEGGASAMMVDASGKPLRAASVLIGGTAGQQAVAYTGTTFLMATSSGGDVTLVEVGADGTPATSVTLSLGTSIFDSALAWNGSRLMLVYRDIDASTGTHVLYSIPLAPDLAAAGPSVMLATETAITSALGVVAAGSAFVVMASEQLWSLGDDGRPTVGPVAAPGGSTTSNLALVAAGSVPFSLDYRLAPEHPFPAAIDDCLAAFRSLLGSGIDPASIAFAGDSAGGGLTVTTCLAARGAGVPMPAAIAAFSPGVDHTYTGATMSTKEGIDPFFTRDDMIRAGAMYLGGQDPNQPLLAPALLADLAGFPPILLQVGTNELLLDDSVRLAARAREADVDVILDFTVGVPHVFQAFVGTLDEADQALDRAALFLTQHLHAH